MKTKLFRKIASIFVSLAFIVSMAVPVFALDDTSTGSITVSGLESKGDLNFYKVIDVTGFENGTPKTPFYKWNDSVASFVYGKYQSYVNKVNEAGTDVYYVSATFMKLDDTSLKSFVEEVAKHVESSKEPNLISPFRTETINSNEQTVNDIAPGAYLILVKNGVKIYSPGFTSVYPKLNTEGNWILEGKSIDYNVNLKSNNPTITKKASKTTVAIGDVVEYTLTVDVPQYGTNAIKKVFSIADTLPSGLGNLANVSIKTVPTNPDNNEEDISEYFTVILDDEKQNLSITVNSTGEKTYQKLLEVYPGLKQITVKYNAEVNSNAYTKITLLNNALLTYNKSPYTDPSVNETKKAEVQLYTYGLQISKKTLDEGGKDITNNELVKGTIFKLNNKVGSNSTLLNFKLSNDGTYYYPVSAGTEGATTELVVKDGKVLIKGLDLGTYTLEETAAPTGYVAPSGVIATIVLNDKKVTTDNSDGVDGNLDNVSASGTHVSKTDDPTASENQLNVTIVNYKNDFNLPNTGDMGTRIFTYVGIALMSGSLILLAVAKKRKAQ